MSCVLAGRVGHFNPLSPHDALKHHFTALKTYLIFLQLEVLEKKFHENGFSIHKKFSLIFKPHQIIFIQVENCDSISRLVVDEGDNGKFRLERLNNVSRPILPSLIMLYHVYGPSKHIDLILC